MEPSVSGDEKAKISGDFLHFSDCRLRQEEKAMAATEAAAIAFSSSS